MPQLWGWYKLGKDVHLALESSEIPSYSPTCGTNRSHIPNELFDLPGPFILFIAAFTLLPRCSSLINFWGPWATQSPCLTLSSPLLAFCLQACGFQHMPLLWTHEPQGHHTQRPVNTTSVFWAATSSLFLLPTLLTAHSAHFPTPLMALKHTSRHILFPLFGKSFLLCTSLVHMDSHWNLS